MSANVQVIFYSAYGHVFHLAEALVAGRQSGQHFWEAELHRLEGALSLRTEAGAGRDTGARGGGERPPAAASTTVLEWARWTAGGQ